jgi:Family of unknown function (DUF5947)
MGFQSSQDAVSGFHKLQELVRQKPPQERCDLCATPVPPAHQHLLEPSSRALVCACEACAILFSTPGAKFRRVPRRIRLIQDFHLPDELWEDLAIPIKMAYFYHDSVAGRARASYPSPAGATESDLRLDAWRDLIDVNPILRTMEPDVEGLLANRLGVISGSGQAEYFLLPIDECYKLVGLIRTRWRGLSGGTEVWKELAEFFSVLRERANVVGGAVCA